MKLVSTSLTRSIVNFAIGLHRRVVLAECEALSRRADGLFAAADRQKKVVAAEHERLEAIRLDAARAVLEADAAWRAADDELAQYPVRP